MIQHDDCTRHSVVLPARALLNAQMVLCCLQVVPMLNPGGLKAAGAVAVFCTAEQSFVLQSTLP